MRLLEEYIKKYGNALNEDVLKVDAFLNHQIDAQLMMELAKDFKEHFKDKHITKIATIETSGIAPAVMLGYLLQVPVVYFKKDTSRIMKDDLYTCQIHSFTKTRIMISSAVRNICPLMTMSCFWMISWRMVRHVLAGLKY